MNSDYGLTCALSQNQSFLAKLDTNLSEIRVMSNDTIKIIGSWHQFSDSLSIYIFAPTYKI